MIFRIKCLLYLFVVHSAIGTSFGQTNDAVLIEELESKIMLEDLGLNEKAILHLELGKLERKHNAKKAFKHFKKSIEEFKSLNNLSRIGEAKHEICKMYIDAQRWDKAIEYGLESLKLTDGKPEPKLLENISLAYIRLKLFDEAISNASIGLTICETKDSVCWSGVNEMLAYVHGEVGNLDSSIYFAEIALNYLNKTNKLSRANIINNLGVTYKDQRKYEKAVVAFNQALKLYQDCKDEFLVAVAYLNIALVETIQLKFDSSFVHSEKALGEFLKYPGHPFLKECYLNLAILSEKKGDSKNALEFYKKHFSALQIDFEQKMKSNIVALQLKNELAIAESDSLAELQRTKKEQKSTNFLWGMSTIALLLLIVIVGLLLKRRRSKHQIDRILLENSQLNQEVLKKRVDFTGAELSQLSAYISSRNEFLANLKDRIKLSKGLSSLDRNELLGSVHQFLNSDQQLQTSDALVEQTNQQILFKLSEKGIKLSTKEKKLLFYILSDLSSKQIADLLKVNSSSIDTARYRIRAKLNVAKGESIRDFLKDLIKN